MTSKMKLQHLTNEMRSKSREQYERVYGVLPQKPLHLYSKTEASDRGFARGRATLNECVLIIELENRTITLPYKSVVPSGEGSCPAIISLEYEKTLPNRFLPAEEIVDRGYAIFSIHIDDISSINESFKSGISTYIYGSRKKKSSPGKIALWAWAAVRMAEHLSSLDTIDSERIIVSGHGIMARSALLASAYTDNIGYIISNNPSVNPTPYCNEKPKSGLTVCDFPYLYSPAFAEDPDTDELELLFLAAEGKHLLVGSAEESDYSCECKKLLNLIENKANSGKSYSITDKNIIPTAPLRIITDSISYHIRVGTEYFSREDWNIYLDYIDSKR